MNNPENNNSLNNIIYPNSFYLSENNYKVLFFDIFIKNDFIYLISPIYNIPYSETDINIIYQNKKLIFFEKHIKNTYEPISIYKYKIKTNEKTINITVKYLDLIKHFTLVVNPNNKKFLTLNTLFKTDYKLINLFYDYYKKQGVEHFYLYYNGKLNDEISSLFKKPDITLIEWNYRYMSDAKYKHHAQLGSLNHCLYKYGKESSEYMIFNDFDEYLRINPNITIFDFLKNNDYDILQFNNIWADTLDGILPNKFPDKFRASKKKSNYKNRSKNIYKCESVEKIGIHFCDYFNKKNINISKNLDMFHFYNWGAKTCRGGIINYLEGINIISI